MDENIEKNKLPIDIEISDDDIYEAMKDIHGYLDVTQADLKEIYKFSYRHALNRITKSIKARDIMTKRVFSVKRGTPLRDAAELMAREKIAGIPVLDEDGKIAGIISEKDFLAHMVAGDKTHCMAIIVECLKGKGCIETPIRSQKAEDIMTSPAVTVEENTTIIEIADIFAAKNINRVPVIDKEEKLIGIVSRADLVRGSLIKDKSSQ